MNVVAEELCREIGQPEQVSVVNRLMPWNRRLLAKQGYVSGVATTRPISKSRSWSEQTTTKVLRREDTSFFAATEIKSLIATAEVKANRAGTLK
jgi:hypothetical protein